MQTFMIGDTIPDIQVTNTEGQLTPLSAQMGEKGLLLFILRGTWCPVCVMQIKMVQRYYTSYWDLGVNSQFVMPEEEDSVWTFKVSQPRPLLFGLHPDPKRETSELFLPTEGIGVLPAAYLLNTDRQVVWQHIGQHLEDRPTHQQLLDAITANLASDALPA